MEQLYPDVENILKIFSSKYKLGIIANQSAGTQARLDNDVAPAKKLGMKTVWVGQGVAKYRSVHSDKENPDCIIESIGEVINIF